MSRLSCPAEWRDLFFVIFLGSSLYSLLLPFRTSNIISFQNFFFPVDEPSFFTPNSLFPPFAPFDPFQKERSFFPPLPRKEEDPKKMDLFVDLISKKRASFSPLFGELTFPPTTFFTFVHLSFFRYAPPPYYWMEIRGSPFSFSFLVDFFLFFQKKFPPTYSPKVLTLFKVWKNSKDLSPLFWLADALCPSTTIFPFMPSFSIIRLLSFSRNRFPKGPPLPPLFWLSRSLDLSCNLRVLSLLPRDLPLPRVLLPLFTRSASKLPQEEDLPFFFPPGTYSTPKSSAPQSNSPWKAPLLSMSKDGFF